MSSQTFGRYFYVGEKPPPTRVRVYKSDGTLDADQLAGKTLVAKVKVGTAAEVDVPCTNAGDGTFTIDWPTGTSVFTGTIPTTAQVDVYVTGGSLAYYLPRLVYPVVVR
jgi:hypothetical protein